MKLEVQEIYWDLIPVRTTHKRVVEVGELSDCNLSVTPVNQRWKEVWMRRVLDCTAVLRMLW
jgi:hypothetical protein